MFLYAKVTLHPTVSCAETSVWLVGLRGQFWRVNELDSESVQALTATRQAAFALIHLIRGLAVGSSWLSDAFDYKIHNQIQWTDLIKSSHIWIKLHRNQQSHETCSQNKITIKIWLNSWSKSTQSQSCRALLRSLALKVASELRVDQRVIP